MKSFSASWVLIFLCCMFSGAVPGYADIWYVDIDNTSGNEDGTSWATAYRSIQDAVNDADAHGGGEVWVAEGAYTAVFDPVLTMVENVHLYGGFRGTETTRDQRDWTAHVSAIDGQDTRRCVKGADNVTLDGFTLRHGKATDGGGMYNDSCSPTVTNCTFTGNSASWYGGGMYNRYGSPTVTNCTFTGNSASNNSGGGIYGSPTVTNCTFTGNSASDDGGGISGSPTVTNCTFTGNSVSYGSGGGISGSPTVTNCTFTGNSASDDGGGISGSPTVTNCT
ncbi:MAG: right-handed parallel beta-helix repeat-containing protein, partial [Candidatus Hydrogenedentes bacterium]|nr:right-handed parallel beta-helix repeat-containing protein [Candidatus Hydrogenedentota bacterium]